MPTVAQIAALAFNGVSGAIPGVVRSTTLVRTTKGAYNVSTGAYATTETAYACRSVAGTASAIPDIFPAYVVGPSDVLLYLEGLTIVPKENDTVGGRIITAVGDIADAGGLYAVVVR